MKKILIALALGITMVGTAQADYYREYRHEHRPVYVERVSTGGEILFPLIIGGIVGAAVANSNRQEPVVVQQQIVQPPPVYVQPQPPQGFVQCPAGTMPFEQRGWVRNAYGQWVQAAYVECK